MRVRDLMRTRTVLSVRADDDVALAAQLLRWGGVRHLPVTDEGAVVGVFSERDLLRYRAETGGHGGLDPIRRFMSAPPVVVGPDDEVDKALGLMVAGKHGCVPVVEGGRLVGIVSATDVVGRVFMKARARGLEARRPLVKDAMRGVPVTTTPDEALFEAVEKMVDHQIRHLPVLDGQGRLVGMISDRDVRVAVGDPVEALRRDRLGTPGLQVSSVMTRSLVTTREETPLAEIIQQFVDERVGAIPVLGAGDALVGIVSYLDVLRASRAFLPAA